jgi:hypothetical protein
MTDRLEALLGGPSEKQRRNATAMFFELIFGFPLAFLAVRIVERYAQRMTESDFVRCRTPGQFGPLITVIFMAIAAGVPIAAAAVVGHLVGRARGPSFQAIAWRGFQIFGLLGCAAAVAACVAGLFDGQLPAPIYLLGAFLAIVTGARLANIWTRVVMWLPRR